MLSRITVARSLASLFGVFSNADRIRLIEELRDRELDVKGLSVALGLSMPRVSQHLSVLRSQFVVVERRQGRHIFYRLAQPGLAGWVLEGLHFLDSHTQALEERKKATGDALEHWTAQEPPPSSADEPAT